MALPCFRRRATLALSLLACAIPLSSLAYSADWGDLTVQFVLDGDIPPVAIIDNNKEALCAKAIDSEELIVNKDNKGIANVFVFIPPTKKPAVHDSLKSSKVKEVVLDQEKCRFIPHAFVLRTDQTLFVKSNDEFNHNTRTNPLKDANAPLNVIIAPKDRKGVEVKYRAAESLPTEIKCDLHAWMSARALVIDHPYGAISDKDGKVKFEKLPAGEVEFRVWHEFNSGLYVERAWKVTVKPGTNDAGVIKVPADKFKKDKQ
ncbi:MAG: hypothetical protein IAG10_28295 [Planctomycetaceae bacterium]|nr:hypothetical protein [Planctomycetaceae bacterium]